MLTGGYPYVVEAGGSAASTTDAFRAVDNRGTIIQLGAVGTGRIDMTALWYKEAVLIGSVDHGRDPKASIGLAPEGRDHSIDVALDILAKADLSRGGRGHTRIPARCLPRGRGGGNRQEDEQGRQGRLPPEWRLNGSWRNLRPLLTA